MNIKCVYCTTISHEYGAKFCTKCGTRLRESSDTRAVIAEDTSVTQIMILSKTLKPYNDCSSSSDYSSSYSSSDSGSSDGGGGGE